MDCLVGNVPVCIIVLPGPGPQAVVAQRLQVIRKLPPRPGRRPRLCVKHLLEAAPEAAALFGPLCGYHSASSGCDRFGIVLYVAEGHHVLLPGHVVVVVAAGVC